MFLFVFFSSINGQETHPTKTLYKLSFYATTHCQTPVVPDPTKPVVPDKGQQSGPPDDTPLTKAETIHTR